MPTTCTVPLVPRETGRAQRLYWHAHGHTLAAWLADMDPIGPVDPDAPGDNADRICTQLNMGYRPTAHAVAWARPHIVRSLCGLIDNRSRVVWTSRPVECSGCLAVLRERDNERPWCGAARELGGQQPCPIKAPCPAGTCRIGGAS